MTHDQPPGIRGRYSEQEEEFLRHQYPEIGLYATCEALGRSPESVMSKAKHMGIRSRTSVQLSVATRASHSVDQHYFDILEGYAKGYIIGFLLADGSMTLTDTAATTCIEIKDCDKPVLQFIKTEMKLTADISHRTMRPMCSISIPTRTMCERLLSLGIHPNKSRTARFPQNADDPEFTRGMICGYFDGDGSAFIRGRLSDLLGVSFTSNSIGLLSDVSSSIERLSGIQGGKISSNKLTYYSNANDLARFMYHKGDPFHLDRKFMICEPFLDQPKPKMGRRPRRRS